MASNAGDAPASVRRDAIAKAVGVSGGMVSNTAAWRAFNARRRAENSPPVRVVPLTESILAVVPNAEKMPDELAELIEEQGRDQADEDALPERRHKRRHGPS